MSLSVVITSGRNPAPPEGLYIPPTYVLPYEATATLSLTAVEDSRLTYLDCVVTYVFDGGVELAATYAGAVVTGNGPAETGKVYSHIVTFTATFEELGYYARDAQNFDELPDVTVKFHFFYAGGYYVDNTYFFGDEIGYAYFPGIRPYHPSTAVSGSCLSLDAYRRPLAASPVGEGITAYVSNDAGHSFLPTVIDQSGTDPSLLVDRRANRYRILYAKGSGLFLIAGRVDDQFTRDSGGAVPLPGLSGSLPVAMQHPSDPDYALLLHSSGGSIVSARSLDAGATWAALGTVAGVDLSGTGRPALCWIGEVAACAYGDGSNLTARVSLDRGRTWGNASAVAGNGPYTGLSLLGWQGTLTLLAFAGTALTPHIFISRDLGRTWNLSPHALPAISPPTGLGVILQSGQLRLGITHHSSDGGVTWIAD